MLTIDAQRQIIRLALLAAVTLGIAFMFTIFGNTSSAEAANIGAGGGAKSSSGGSGSNSPCKGCGGSGSGGGGHTSTYKGVAVWKDATRFNTSRNSTPSPLGTYLNDTKNKNRAIKQWNKKCLKTTSSTKTYGGKTVKQMALGVNWAHSVKWNRNASAISSSTFNPGSCVTAAKLKENVYICPVKVYDGKYQGRLGTKLPEGTTQDTTWKRAKLLDRRNGQLRFADDTSTTKTGIVAGVGTKYYGNKNYSVSDFTANCAANKRVEASYDIGEDIEISPQTVGVYDMQAKIDRVTCKSAVAGRHVATHTKAGSTNKGHNRRTDTTTYQAQTLPLGCVARDTISGKASAALFCDYSKYQNGQAGAWGWKQNINVNGSNPAEKASFMNRDYAQDYTDCAPPPQCPPGDDACTPPTEDETPSCDANDPACIEEIRIPITDDLTCKVDSSNINVRIINKDGTRTRIENGAVVTGNGKQLEVRFAQPELEAEEGSSLSNFNITDRQQVFSVDDNGAYPKLDDGLQGNDPVASNISLRGGTTDSWTSPLNIRLFKPSAAVNAKSQQAEIVPLTINQNNTFTYTAPGVEYVYTFNSVTGAITEREIPQGSIEQTGSCPTQTFTVYVAGSRITE